MLLVNQTSAYAQLITVLVIFVLIMALTWWVTKWIASYQKEQNAGKNIEVIESTRIGNNIWVQIVRVGDLYKAVAIGKDQVTYLGDIDPDTLKKTEKPETVDSFKVLLEKVMRRSEDPEKEDKG